MIFFNDLENDNGKYFNVKNFLFIKKAYLVYRPKLYFKLNQNKLNPSGYLHKLLFNFFIIFTVILLNFYNVCASAVVNYNENLFAASIFQSSVTGTVLDDKGETLPGVSVKIKGSNVVVITNSQGKYSVSAKGTDILQFSFVGYETVELAIKNKTVVNVSLKESLMNLDQVVVVGYGTVSKRDVTGAISSITSKQIQERAPVNIFDALQGLAPGVEISQEDGRAGAQGSITIRGIGTLGAGAAPLYIVDGAQGVNIDGINPMDIERVEILKDAASAAIYGTRGANGVVLITTKRGAEGKPKIEATGLSTYGRIAHRIPVANADERRLFESKISGSGALSTDSLTPGRNADNNPYDFVTRIAKRQDANVSLSGASKTLKYFTGIGYSDDESVIVNQWAKQARFRMNLDFMPSEKFTMSNSLQFSVRNENMVSTRYVLYHALARIPYYVYYYPDGSLAPTISGRRNPLANALLGVNLNKTYDANLYNMVEYKFTPVFKFTADAALRYSANNQFQFTPRLLNACTSCTNPNNSGQEDTGLRTEWITQAYFNYNKSFNKNHTLTAVVGGSFENKSRFSSRMTGSDYLTEEVLTMNSAQITGVPTSSKTENVAASLFSRVGYNYKGRYQLNGIMRADGSSRFGADNRWGYFPSISGAWTFSSESFMRGISKVVTNGKLRAGYGIVGNDQSLGDYDAVQQYIFGSSFYNGVSGVSPNSTYGNNLLSWETNKQLSVGLDVALFNGKINFSADFYNKITQDLLYSSPLVVETGFSRVSVNLGTIRNRGFEFIVTATPYSKKNWNWTVSYNIAFNKGLVKELANHTPIQSGAGSLTEEGQPLGNFFGWRQLRVFPYDESNAFDNDMNPLTPNFNGSTFTGYTLNGQPYTGTVRKKQTNGLISAGGDVDWEDLDKNGIIDDADRSILGNGQADYVFGLTNNVSYKGFSLGFTIYGSMGGQIYNSALAAQTRYSDTGDSPPPSWIYGAWFNPGDITDMPKAKTGSTIGNGRAISSRYIEDGSFIRLRNIRVGYQLPKKVSSYVGAQRVSFYVQGNNLMTYSNYQHFDPEISKSNPLQLGVDSENARIPRKNEILFGLNVTF
jgi:TonB-linked SusC/RagA family outer membrane protein